MGGLRGLRRLTLGLALSLFFFSRFFFILILRHYGTGSLVLLFSSTTFFLFYFLDALSFFLYEHAGGQACSLTVLSASFMIPGPGRQRYIRRPTLFWLLPLLYLGPGDFTVFALFWFLS